MGTKKRVVVVGAVILTLAAFATQLPHLRVEWQIKRFQQTLFNLQQEPLMHWSVSFPAGTLPDQISSFDVMQSEGREKEVRKTSWLSHLFLHESATLDRLFSHLESLEKLGEVKALRFKLHHLLQNSLAYNSFNREWMFGAESPDALFVYHQLSAVGAPVELRIWCRNEDVEAWRLFIAAQDVPDYEQRVVAATGQDTERTRCAGYWWNPCGFSWLFRSGPLP